VEPEWDDQEPLKSLRRRLVDEAPFAAAANTALDQGTNKRRSARRASLWVASGLLHSLVRPYSPLTSRRTPCVDHQRRPVFLPLTHVVCKTAEPPHLPVLPPCHIALTGTVYGLTAVGRAGSPARSQAAPPPPSLSTVDDVRKRLYSLLDEAPEWPAVDANTSDDLICREQWSEEEEEAGASAGGIDDRARRRRAGTGYSTDDVGDDSDDSPALHVGTGGRRPEQQQARNPPTNSAAAPTDVIREL
jgi:hypothetical protein